MKPSPEESRTIFSALALADAGTDQRVRAAVDYYRRFGVEKGLASLGRMAQIGPGQELTHEEVDMLYALARIGAGAVLTAFNQSRSED